MKNTILLIASIFLFSNCTKVIDLDLKDTSPTVVIEGNITNQVGPYLVRVTKTVNFSNANLYPPVTNAVVKIIDNAGQNETLTYTTNGYYTTNNLKGIVGRTYTLTVTVDGKTYSAVSRMEQNVVLDSLKYTSLKLAGYTTHTVIPVFRDPITLGNNYRFVTKVNAILDKTYIVTNDNVNNGLLNERPLRLSDIEVETGNLVEVEMQCIDANAYTYYFVLAQIAGNGPGGGTTPTNPPNGISNGALGLFSAYTTQKKSIRIP